MTVLVSHCAEEIGVQTVLLRARPHLVRWGWRRRRVGLAGSGVLGPSPGGAWRGTAPGGSSLTKTPSLGSELGPDAQPTMWMCVDWCFCANTALQLPGPDQNQLRGRGRRVSVRGRDQPRLSSGRSSRDTWGLAGAQTRTAVRGSPGCGGARGAGEPGVWGSPGWGLVPRHSERAHDGLVVTEDSDGQGFGSHESGGGDGGPEM